MMTHSVTFSKRLDADHHSLSTMRATLREWLVLEIDATSASPTFVDDADLVVTELAANVIDHTSSPWVDVTVISSTPGLTIEVSHRGTASGLPPAGDWGSLAEGDRGRGLRIVRALCDDIGVDHADDASTIRCRMVS